MIDAKKQVAVFALYKPVGILSWQNDNIAHCEARTYVCKRLSEPDFFYRTAMFSDYECRRYGSIEVVCIIRNLKLACDPAYN
jgi:hypothetical protein